MPAGRDQIATKHTAEEEDVQQDRLKGKNLLGSTEISSETSGQNDKSNRPGRAAGGTKVRVWGGHTPQKDWKSSRRRAGKKGSGRTKGKEKWLS